MELSSFSQNIGHSVLLLVMVWYDRKERCYVVLVTVHEVSGYDTCNNSTVNLTARAIVTLT